MVTMSDVPSLPHLLGTDRLRVCARVLAPLVAVGPVLRRPRVGRAAQALQLDQRTWTVLRSLRERYGPAPVLLTIAGRTLAIVLRPDDVRRVLSEAPEPFTPANREKRFALGGFEPEAVLISKPGMRPARRQFNEDVLKPTVPVHDIGPAVADIAAAQTRELMAHLPPGEPLTWPVFSAMFWRVIRCVVLGEGARDAEQLTDLLGQLRAAGNWSYLGRGHRGREQRFRRELAAQLRRAEPGSLAGVLAASPASPASPADAGVEPAGQVPHWLFAFDAAGIAAFRALALLATHPETLRRVRAEVAAPTTGHPPVLELLRACVSESLRLWPTTLVLLRDATSETIWGGRSAPAGTGFVIVSSFFHRDRTVLDYADRFEPDAWLDGRAGASWSIVPFSAGPAVCPGRNVVLMVTSLVLAEMLRLVSPELSQPGRLVAGQPLPATLEHSTLSFRLRAA